MEAFHKLHAQEAEQCMQARTEKMAEEDSKEAEGGRKRGRGRPLGSKSKPKPQDNLGHSDTPHEAVAKLLHAKKLTSKVDYTNLDRLLENPTDRWADLICSQMLFEVPSRCSLLRVLCARLHISCLDYKAQLLKWRCCPVRSQGRKGKLAMLSKSGSAGRLMSQLRSACDSSKLWQLTRTSRQGPALA